MNASLHAETARQNGAKSNGPASPEGKAKSAQNAVKHGLTAKTFNLTDPEDKRAFSVLEAELIGTYLAVTPLQKRQAGEMAIAMWRQRIIANMEIALLAAIERGEASANEGGVGLPSLNAIYRYRARIERDLKTARETLRELQAARVRMFEHKLKKAKEFKELNLRRGLEAELGEDAFDYFRLDCTNEPNLPPEDPDPKLNREQRRRMEALERKKK